MDNGEAAERARQPEDLDRLFLERANAGDVEGVEDLYEPDEVRAGRGPRLSARPAGRRPAGDPGGVRGPADRPAAVDRRDPPGDPQRRHRYHLHRPRGQRHGGSRPPPARRHLAVADRPAEPPGVTARERGAGSGDGRIAAWTAGWGGIPSTTCSPMSSPSTPSTASTTPTTTARRAWPCSATWPASGSSTRRAAPACTPPNSSAVVPG